MNMPSVDCPVVLLPSNSMDSGSEATRLDDMFAKNWFHIFFQLKGRWQPPGSGVQDLRATSTERAHAWGHSGLVLYQQCGLYGTCEVCE
jgi:hypothetical protein